MFTNLMIDFGLGLVPVLGDLADAFFKCNTRNNMLLEKYLREKGQRNLGLAPTKSSAKRWFGSKDKTSHPEAQPPAPDVVGGSTVHNTIATSPPVLGPLFTTGNHSISFRCGA